MWVANFGEGSVTRINASLNEVNDQSIRVGNEPAAIAVLPVESNVRTDEMAGG